MSHSSQVKRSVVLGMIQDALSYDDSNTGIKYSYVALKQAGEYMKQGWVKATEELIAPVIGAGTGNMTREDREYCWQELQSAYERIKDRQKRVKDNNYSSISHRINRISDLATYGSTREAIDEIKATQQAMKGLSLEDHHYRSIRDSLDRYFHIAIGRAKEKQQTWQDNMRDKISRLQDVIDKQNNFIEKQKSHIYDLRDKRDNAWSSDFRDKVNGWIDEAESKMSSAYRTINDIEGKIQEIRSKMNR